jgi:hypothetical protein
MKKKNSLLIALGLGFGLSLSVSAVPLNCEHQYRQCVDSKDKPGACEEAYMRCMEKNG